MSLINYKQDQRNSISFNVILLWLFWRTRNNPEKTKVQKKIKGRVLRSAIGQPYDWTYTFLPSSSIYLFLDPKKYIFTIHKLKKSIQYFQFNYQITDKSTRPTPHLSHPTYDLTKE